MDRRKKRRQDIIWTKDAPVHWPVYALLCRKQESYDSVNTCKSNPLYYTADLHAHGALSILYA